MPGIKKSGTGRETGQGHSRGAETASTDRAKAPVQDTHHSSGEEREEDIETTDTEGEEEETPSRRAAQAITEVYLNPKAT